MCLNNFNFKKWLNEMYGSYAIVGCKDKKNPNFQIWGALSDLNCHKRKSKKKDKNKINKFS